MKTINPNCWAPYECESNVPVPITAPPVANINNLYYSFYDVVLFYYILERVASYNILDEDNYFYEDD